MYTYISMLRGINVTGHRMIKMIELKALYESLRFKNVSTYIQSGNVVFQSRSNDPVSIGTTLEKAIEKSFGFPVSVVLRRPAELRKIIGRCPFLGAMRADESRLCITFLQSRPKPLLIKTMAPMAARSTDTYAVIGKEIYLHCPNGYGKTIFSIGFFEKNLKVVATTRNWRTLHTLISMSSESDRTDS